MESRPTDGLLNESSHGSRLSDVELPKKRRMRLIKSNDYTNLRVRKLRSIDSQQVGEVMQWPEVYEFLEILDGWAKISPIEYTRVNRNFPKFNPEIEGWCKTHSPVTDQLILENAP